jgi:RES domain-containing protein
VKGYRNQASGFDPRSGDGARRFGGRFNRPHSYPVVYLCTTRPCVVAELTRQARRQGLAVEDLLPRELWPVTVVLTKVLDLTDADTLQALVVEPDELVRVDLQLTHEIGVAAHEHRFQAIRSVSVTPASTTLLRSCPRISLAPCWQRNWSRSERRLQICTDRLKCRFPRDGHRIP